MNHISGTAYHTSRHMCKYMRTPKFTNDKNLLFPSSPPSFNQNESLTPCHPISQFIRLLWLCDKNTWSTSIPEYVLFDVVFKRCLGWEQKGRVKHIVHVVIVLKNVPEFHRTPFILDLKEEHEPCKPALKSRVTYDTGNVVWTICK